MSIARSVRKAGRLCGRVIDAEDRRLLSQGAVLITGAGAVVIGAAGIVGAAARIFAVSAGL